MLRRPGSIKLMDLFGIRISVDAGWFLTLFLVILWLSPSFRRTLNSSDGVAYLTTVLSALLFFASLVVHELGHALVARRNGIEVRNIQLFLFGGLTQMSREAQTPGEEFRIAAAGPAATLLMVIVFLVIDLAIVGPHLLWDAIRLAPNITITPVLLGLSWLLLMNVVVLLFNLVPAFPLDGGRIARAIVWRTTNDKRRGTRAAAQLGQAFAIVLAGLGIWLMLSGSLLGGLWLLMLAFLLGQSARGALVQSALTERIEGVRVADIMDRHPVTIPGSTPVTRALDEYFLRYGWSWFPVVDDAGRFMGVSRQERVQTAVDGGEGWLTVDAVVDAEEAGNWRVNEDRPLTELLSSEPLGRLGALMAVDGEGVLRGVVTVEQVRRALQSALGPPPAGAV
ncbi:MAG TPA: site-2 protease family protein [Solirubrobacteraceae bacterium]|nr:site-2 protease family protein [Solirubrobacteraceae bacterium]